MSFKLVDDDEISKEIGNDYRHPVFKIRSKESGLEFYTTHQKRIIRRIEFRRYFQKQN
jgi:hypothetical protein